MSKFLKPLLLASVFLAPLAHAADDEEAAAPPNVAAKGKNLYVGVGLFSDMLNVNLERVTDWGNFMVRVGTFHNNEGLGANLSWRKTLEGGDGHTPGFYVGAFAGHVASENVAGDSIERLGAGGEMGYHWVKEYTRAELTVGLGAAEPIKEKTVEYAAEPTIFISFSMALGY